MAYPKEWFVILTLESTGEESPMWMIEWIEEAEL